MLKCSYAHRVQRYPVWVYAHIFISPELNNYSFIDFNENLIILLFYPLFNHVWLLSKKNKVHQAFNLFQLLFSCRANKVALPSKWWHVYPKACHTGFHYISPSMDGDYSNQGCLQWSLFRIHTNYPCPFCHTNFIN